uniref:Uncharacterized protein n=1 Tax=Arundo donax TaxID=35708 RepID=A0A0A9G545_ARUDO
MRCRTALVSKQRWTCVSWEFSLAASG